MDLVYTIAFKVPFVLHCIDLRCSVCLLVWAYLLSAVSIVRGPLAAFCGVSLNSQRVELTYSFALYTSFFCLETYFPLLRR
jgi:hypothetical protein